MGKLLNKKAQTPQDMILLVIILFSLAIVSIFGYFIYAQINSYRTNIPQMNTTMVNDAMNKTQVGNGNLDYVFLVLYIGMSLALVAIGWFIPTDSIFLWLYIIILLVVVLVAAIFGFVWQTIVATPSPISTVIQNNFPIMNYILSNITMFELITSALAMVATFAKGGRNE